MSLINIGGMLLTRFGVSTYLAKDLCSVENKVQVTCTEFFPPVDASEGTFAYVMAINKAKQVETLKIIDMEQDLWTFERAVGFGESPLDLNEGDKLCLVPLVEIFSETMKEIGRSFPDKHDPDEIYMLGDVVAGETGEYWESRKDNNESSLQSPEWELVTLENLINAYVSAQHKETVGV